MSWQQYVDSNLLGTGKVQKAAIHGLDGSLWATSAGFSVGPAEAAAIVKGFTDPSGLRASGIFIVGEKYMTLRADDRAIYGKKLLYEGDGRWMFFDNEHANDLACGGIQTCQRHEAEPLQSRDRLTIWFLLPTPDNQ
ncbi:hypothetical protein PhCBS80983_g05986 [Powellomyces hirtus]|uniref:Profilin n=1 Tax=Powellomyces hirtus TaxID=109895 RepID=A0A507DR95_9FUNG|nr:hypothetical protein PhCBS80983_g05986 [Powellomyces hirtus]